jgi:hypothetical protein
VVGVDGSRLVLAVVDGGVFFDFGQSFTFGSEYYTG